MIYTDGSKGLNLKGIKATSAALVAYYKGREVFSEKTNLGPFLEIADTESYAASRAIELAYKRLKTSPITVKEVYLYIDSQVAIQRLKNNAYALTL